MLKVVAFGCLIFVRGARGAGSAGSAGSASGAAVAGDVEGGRGPPSQLLRDSGRRLRRRRRRLSGFRKWRFMKWWFSNGSKMHTSKYVCENLAQTVLCPDARSRRGAKPRKAGTLFRIPSEGCPSISADPICPFPQSFASLRASLRARARTRKRVGSLLVARLRVALLLCRLREGFITILSTVPVAVSVCLLDKLRVVCCVVVVVLLLLLLLLLLLSSSSSSSSSPSPSYSLRVNN